MSLLRALLLSTFCLFVAPLHAQSLDSLTGTPVSYTHLTLPTTPYV
jgi:hypothetical protein